MAAFDDAQFRGGLARTYGRLRLTAGSNQLELGDGCVLTSTNTADRTITFPDNTGTVALIGDIVAGSVKATTTTLGAVIVPTTGHLIVDGSGNVVVNETDVPLLASNNTFAGTNTFSDRLTLTKGLVGTPTGLTYSASMTATVTAATVFTVAMIHATSATANLALSASPTAGKVFWVVVSADDNTDVLTFTTHFKSTGTVTPGIGKAIAVGFVGNGTDAIEFARTSVGV